MNRLKEGRVHQPHTISSLNQKTELGNLLCAFPILLRFSHFLIDFTPATITNLDHKNNNQGGRRSLWKPTSIFKIFLPQSSSFFVAVFHPKIQRLALCSSAIGCPFGTSQSSRLFSSVVTIWYSCVQFPAHPLPFLPFPTRKRHGLSEQVNDLLPCLWLNRLSSPFMQSKSAKRVYRTILVRRSMGWVVARTVP